MREELNNLRNVISDLTLVNVDTLEDFKLLKFLKHTKAIVLFLGVHVESKNGFDIFLRDSVMFKQPQEIKELFLEVNHKVKIIYENVEKAITQRKNEN